MVSGHQGYLFEDLNFLTAKTWKKVQKGHPIRRILTHPDKGGRGRGKKGRKEGRDQDP